MIDVYKRQKEVFGERADEYFHAWHVARYINYVAKAGKEIYPLPLYINVALRDPLTNPTADHYESGGATDNVISCLLYTSRTCNITGYNASWT